MFQFIANALAEEATATDAVVEAAEKTPTWFETAFKEMGKFPVWGWVLMAVLLIGGFIAYKAVKGDKKSAWTTKKLSMGAICIALSSVLSMIRLWKMPMGGSITPASMLPLMLFAYVYGTGSGCTLGVIYGVLQFILDGGDAAAYGVTALLLDYPIAFAMMGLAGAFRSMKNENVGLALGVVLACFGRYLASFVSGWVFYGSYASYYGFVSPVVYSICYNGAYMLPECIICVLLAMLMGNRLVKSLKQNAK